MLIGASKYKRVNSIAKKIDLGYVEMWRPVSITGPLSVRSPLLNALFGADSSPWAEDWEPSALQIASCLEAGTIPYTNIAALAFKVIMHYSKDGKSTATVVWSSANEVMAILKDRFVAAYDMAPDHNQDVASSLAQYLSSFDVLVATFCLPSPLEAIVLKPEATPIEDEPSVADSDIGLILSSNEKACDEWGIYIPDTCNVLTIEVDGKKEEPQINLTRKMLQNAGLVSAASEMLLRGSNTSINAEIKAQNSGEAQSMLFNYL